MSESQQYRAKRPEFEHQHHWDAADVGDARWKKRVKNAHLEGMWWGFPQGFVISFRNSKIHNVTEVRYVGITIISLLSVFSWSYEHGTHI
jgi:hypothetical protein